MDIFGCFRWLSKIERIVPWLVKVEVKKGTSTKQHFSFWIIFALVNILGLFVGWQAINTLIEITRMTNNVIEVVIFLDNYAALVLHFSLFRTWRKVTKRNPILWQIQELDQFLTRACPLITIDYKSTQRRSFLQYFAFQCVLLAAVMIYVSEFTDEDLSIFFPSIYFFIVLSLLLVNLTVYRTIAAIILQKVRLVLDNYGQTTTEQGAKCVILILSCIKSANELGGKLVFVFVSFSSFYLTFGIFVLTRFYQTSLSMSSFVLYVSFTVALNLYIVTPAYLLKLQLDGMESRIGGMELENEVS